MVGSLAADSCIGRYDGRRPEVMKKKTKMMANIKENISYFMMKSQAEDRQRDGNPTEGPPNTENYIDIVHTSLSCP